MATYNVYLELCKQNKRGKLNNETDELEFSRVPYSHPDPKQKRTSARDCNCNGGGGGAIAS